MATNAGDPTRAAFSKAQRALEGLTADEQRRVISALGVLFNVNVSAEAARFTPQPNTPAAAPA